MTSPSRVAIVIVDQTGSDSIQKIIPIGYTSWVLPVRNEYRFINSRILLLLVRNLRLLLSNQINALGWYVLSVSQALGADVLITFIDNCSWDKNLHKVSGLRVVCVQNGIRSADDLLRKHYDVLLCMGEREAQLISHQSNMTEPIGSINLALAQENQALLLQDESVPRIDIFFVSQYRREFWNSPREVDRLHVRAVQKTLDWINTIAVSRQLTVGVAFSAKGPDRDILFEEEHQIYRNHLAHGFQIFRREGFNQRGIDCSYGGLIRSRVVVTFSSSMTLEALGLGKHVVMTTQLHNDRTSEHYRWFPPQDFAPFLVEPDFQSFEGRVLTALASGPSAVDSYDSDFYCARPDPLGTIKQAQATVAILINQQRDYGYKS